MNIWNKVKNTDFLGDKLSNSRKNIGFEEETESSETEKGPDITEEELLSAEEEYDKNNNSSRSLRKRIVKDMQRGRAGLGGSLDDDGE